MLVNKTTLAAIFTNLRTTYNQAFAAAPSTWQRIAMLVPSTTSQEDYAWLSQFPKMRRWIGEKAIKSLSAYKYTVVNDDFEATIEVNRNNIEDDTIGIYKPMAQGAGYSAKQWPDEMVAEVVNGAFTTACFDGQYFVDTDHPVGDGAGGTTSVSNKGTLALSGDTLALARASYGVARTAMMMFKDDEGRPLNVIPNVLLVGPALEDTARMLLTVDRLEDGKPNPYKGTATLEVDTRITSTTAWFLLDTSKPVKPFVFQQRKAPVFVSQTDPQSDNVFNRKSYRFGAEARGASGYGFWQTCWGSTGTT